MHDTDRTQLEFESDLDEFESDAYEYSAAAQGESTVFSEADEMELAAELLATSDEHELDQFIGKLIGQAGEVSGQPAKGKTGSKLGNFLKGALKKVLPAVAGAAGTLFGGPLGGMAASKLASSAGKAFGLELEGLSPEDQEYETARRFVRFAGEAACQAGKEVGRAAAAANDPQVAQQLAKKAVTTAARKFAPGLLRPVAPPVQSEVPGGRGGARRGAAGDTGGAGGAGAGAGSTGRWIRQGQKIVLLGV